MFLHTHNAFIVVPCLYWKVLFTQTLVSIYIEHNTKSKHPVSFCGFGLIISQRSKVLASCLLQLRSLYVYNQVTPQELESYNGNLIWKHHHALKADVGRVSLTNPEAIFDSTLASLYKNSCYS